MKREKKKKEKIHLQKKKKKKTCTGRHEYEISGGIALEAQDFTDFLHHPDFPSCVLEPGQAMTRVFELRWGTTAAERSKKEGGKTSSSCGAPKEAAAVTAPRSDKSAVGAEEMMM